MNKNLLGSNKSYKWNETGQCESDWKNVRVQMESQDILRWLGKSLSKQAIFEVRTDGAEGTSSVNVCRYQGPDLTWQRTAR